MAQQAQATASSLERGLQDKTAQLQELQSQLKEKLGPAVPQLEEGQTAMTDLEDSDVADLRGLASPAQGVIHIMQVSHTDLPSINDHIYWDHQHYQTSSIRLSPCI